MYPVIADIALLDFPPSYLLMGSAVVFVMYMTFRPKKRDPLGAAQPFRTSLVQQRALERDMQHVIVELSEMTRQMSAQIETRATKLEQLMRDADAKIAELRAAEETAKASLTAATHSAGEVNELTTIITDTITATPAPERPKMRLVSDANPHSEDRWAEVYRLGDEGLTLPEIARRLARPNGEVELILALRPKPSDDQHADRRSNDPISATGG